MAKKEEAPEEAKPKIPWHAMDLEAVYKELGKDGGLLKSGLTTAEADERVEKYGENKMSEKKKATLLERIWKLVANVLVAILVFVAVISAIRAATAKQSQNILSNWIQVGLIVFVITLNTTIGLIQEGSAEKAAEALQAMLSSDAVLIRDGKEVKVSANMIVPGDVVKLSLGDRVPADLRMVRVSQLSASEAALTGESVPVEKTTPAIETDGDPMQQPLGDRHNMCFSATLVSQGSGVGVVVATGDNTEIGTINALVSQVEEKKTNVLEQIDRVSSVLAVFILATAIACFFTAWKRTGMEPIVALTTCLVAAVAMIPEGLEAIVTMTYAWAVSNMAKNNAIVRALPAVETLGSVTIICSDKTGTLTQNIMSLTAFVTSGKRYRNNVNAKERSNVNFVVDNSYMAKRADHAKFKRARQVIQGGPSQAGKKGKRGSTFPFGITAGFGKTEHGAGTGNPEDDPNAPKTEDEPAPVAADDAFPTGESPDEAFLRQGLVGGVLCSHCVLGEGGGREGEIGNPTELSILRASYFGGVEISSMKDEAPVIAEVPFSSEYKFMATVHEPKLENDGPDNMDGLVVHVKGAPDRMVAMCKYQAKDGKLDKASEEPIQREYWIEQIAVLSSHGLRVLALCRGKIPKGSVTPGQNLGPAFVQEKGQWLTLVGLCAIVDPPRPECVRAIAEAHGAGVRIAMITGDHKDTALAIGGQLGLVDEEHSEAITGPELDAMSDEELKLAAQKYNVFARASPQNKIRIVKALQSQGEICGMTGDGVNDAPALKAADMGVAMGKEGTDVAREAAEMILADDNFATIITAVREGRVVWDNLRKALLVNTPINNAQGMSVLFGLIAGLPRSPLSSIQVLYCNLICAVTLGFVCAVEPAEDGIMRLPPRRIGKRLIGRFLFLRIALGTVTLIACTLGAVFILRDLGGYGQDEQRAQALNTLSFGAISITLSARFSYNSSLHPRIFSDNPLVWWSVAIMVGLQVFITYCPWVNTHIFSMKGMDWRQWVLVLGFMVLVMLVMEMEKSVRRYLASLGEDTDDREYGYFDEVPGEPVDTPLPDSVRSYGRTELRK